jgi:hypothetical protein
MSEQEQLESVIKALDLQRGVLGNSAVDAAISALRARQAAIDGKTASIPPATDGERRSATVVFADLTGLTVLSESLDPEACAPSPTPASMPSSLAPPSVPGSSIAPAPRLASATSSGPCASRPFATPRNSGATWTGCSPSSGRRPPPSRDLGFPPRDREGPGDRSAFDRLKPSHGERFPPLPGPAKVAQAPRY